MTDDDMVRLETRAILNRKADEWAVEPVQTLINSLVEAWGTIIPELIKEARMQNAKIILLEAWKEKAVKALNNAYRNIACECQTDILETLEEIRVLVPSPETQK